VALSVVPFACQPVIVSVLGPVGTGFVPFILLNAVLAPFRAVQIPPPAIARSPTGHDAVTVRNWPDAFVGAETSST
jgi:hypothetical protein